MHLALGFQGIERAADAGHSPLPITVLFTTEAATIEALKRAAMFARGMEARIRLVLLEVVPYPLSFGEGPCDVEFLWRKLTRTAERAGLAVEIEFYLCRDPRKALKELLMPPSLLVVGGPAWFWRTSEQRLARWLTRQGHHVVFVPVPVSR